MHTAVSTALSDVQQDGIGDALEQIVDVDAAPRGFDRPSTRGKIGQARDFFEHILDPKDRG